LPFAGGDGEDQGGDRADEAGGVMDRSRGREVADREGPQPLDQGRLLGERRKARSRPGRVAGRETKSGSGGSRPDLGKHGGPGRIEGLAALNSSSRLDTWPRACNTGRG